MSLMNGEREKMQNSQMINYILIDELEELISHMAKLYPDTTITARQVLRTKIMRLEQSKNLEQGEII